MCIREELEYYYRFFISFITFRVKVFMPIPSSNFQFLLRLPWVHSSWRLLVFCSLTFVLHVRSILFWNLWFRLELSITNSLLSLNFKFYLNEYNHFLFPKCHFNLNSTFYSLLSNFHFRTIIMVYQHLLKFHVFILWRNFSFDSLLLMDSQII